MKVCCGGILGLGEGRKDRAGLLKQLANLPEHPESVPINMLVKVAGTPLENADDVDEFEDEGESAFPSVASTSGAKRGCDNGHSIPSVPSPILS